jgi:hypothetical protein
MESSLHIHPRDRASGPRRSILSVSTQLHKELLYFFPLLVHCCGLLLLEFIMKPELVCGLFPIA